MDTSSWRELISRALEEQREAWSDVVRCTLTDAEMDVRFDEGYGSAEGKPFTLWTAQRVYFPVVYDGSEWVESVPREPCDEATKHFGGQ